MSNLKTLVIVESPSKADKIQTYLGKNFIVMASRGHITDLAKGGKHGMGVDIDNNFKPRYVLMDDKLSTLDALLTASKSVDQIFVASDPDREGEAIAWHLAARLDGTGKPIKRMVFNEIKKDKLLKAVKDVREINMDLFHSQEARRILDRLVGFMASPFLMNFFGPKLSAGRVQSVVTRMVIDREREIETFIPEEYWTIQVKLTTDSNDNFLAKYSGKLTDAVIADNVKKSLDVKDYVICDVVGEEEKKLPQPPLVTSTLQRIMSKVHGFGAERTMKAAQALYESGYCTYIRTDSIRVGDDALKEVRQWIGDNKYEVPKRPNIFKNKDAAQDAHECIRPSDLTLLPGKNYAIIDSDEKLVYETIWKYFIASQMMPAIYDTMSVTACPKDNSTFKVKSTGKAIKYNGYMEILGIEDNNSIDIPMLTVGQTVKLLNKNDLKLDKKQTQPPARYSEDKLIKELVNKNIGRPATYADLLGKITSRNYVEKRGNVYHATDLGKKITDELSKYFTFMDYNYTANMERQLDEIEGGKVNHIDMLKKFFPEFKSELDRAYLDHGGCLCEKCGSPMSSRTAKDSGKKFMGCTAFPKCRFIKNSSTNLVTN
jgi:DNA topoisomerase-1